jgi:Tol biopolymer transport system component
MRRLTRTRMLAHGCVLVFTALAVLGAPRGVGATSPGANGRIAFTSNLSGTWQLYTMNPNGSGMVQLTNLPSSTDIDLFAEWSPDGSRLLFASSITGTPQIYSIRADGTGTTQITNDPNGDLAPDWSPDGTKITFVGLAANGNGVICVMNADGAGRHCLTTDVFGSFAPEYTPDGKKILFESQLDGLVSAIWSMNADGSHQHRLTPAALEAGGVDISPDGKHVAFVNHTSSGLPNSIYVMTIDGTGITRLTNPRGGHSDGPPKYSPDGTRILFSSNRPFPDLANSALFTMNANGTGIKRVTASLTLGGCPSPGNCVGPDWGAAA